MHHKIETANGCIDTDHCSVSLKLHFLPSNLHLHSHEICFASVFDSFTPLIMLNASRFMSSILLGNHLFGKHWPKHAWSFYIHRYTFYSQCSTLSTSTIKACLMQYIMIFHQIFMNAYNITDIHSLISNRKIMQGSLEPVFFVHCKTFCNTSQTQWIWFYFRALCFELMGLHVINSFLSLWTYWY